MQYEISGSSAVKDIILYLDRLIESYVISTLLGWWCREPYTLIPPPFTLTPMPKMPRSSPLTLKPGLVKNLALSNQKCQFTACPALTPTMIRRRPLPLAGILCEFGKYSSPNYLCQLPSLHSACSNVSLFQ